MKNSPESRDRGFTLIELLVVIAIIGILVAIAYASLDTARKKARDNQRMANLKQLQAAIEVYGQAHGKYPDVGCDRGTSWTGHGSEFGSCAVYIVGIEDLISPLPVDPVNNVQGYIYRTNTDRTAYKVMSRISLESMTIDGSSEYARYRDVDGCDEQMTGNAQKTLALYGGKGLECG